MRVLDGAVAIFDGVMGVEAQTKTVWKQANRYNVPRIAFVNKMDKPGADFEYVLRTMEEKLKCIPIPIQIPYGESDKFKGAFDLINLQLLEWNADKDGKTVVRTPVEQLNANDEYLMSHVQAAKQKREEMIERIAELDDKFADLYLQNEKMGIQDIMDALRRITIAFKGVVVLCGSSLKNKGVQPVLDAVLSFLPSPMEKNAPQGKYQFF